MSAHLNIRLSIHLSIYASVCVCELEFEIRSQFELPNWCAHLHATAFGPVELANIIAVCVASLAMQRNQMACSTRISANPTLEWLEPAINTNRDTN